MLSLFRFTCSVALQLMSALHMLNTAGLKTFLQLIVHRRDVINKLYSLGQRILSKQPLSVLLGTELDVFEPGTAILTLRVKDEIKQQHGFVHGGVVSYLADNALTFAGGSILGDAVTSEYKINYLRPALGETLIARAHVVSSGANQAVCQCTVNACSDDKEQIVAVAQGTILKARPKA